MNAVNRLRKDLQDSYDEGFRRGESGIAPDRPLTIGLNNPDWQACQWAKRAGHQDGYSQFEQFARRIKEKISDDA